MGRTAQISKEEILSAGVRIIVKQGYSAITVKSLAQEVGCSTQPVLWHFGNMESFRKQLAPFALQHLRNKMNLPTQSAMQAFGFVGYAWLDTAIDEPNLLSYLFSTDLYSQQDFFINKVLNNDETDELAQAISKQLGCEVSVVNRIMMTLKLFSLGMMNVLLHKNVQLTKQQAHSLLRDVAITQMVGIGVDKEAAESFLLKV